MADSEIKSEDFDFFLAASRDLSRPEKYFRVDIHTFENVFRLNTI